MDLDDIVYSCLWIRNVADSLVIAIGNQSALRPRPRAKGAILSRHIAGHGRACVMQSNDIRRSAGRSARREKDNVTSSFQLTRVIIGSGAGRFRHDRLEGFQAIFFQPPSSG
jgi:hypothetical protein